MKKVTKKEYDKLASEFEKAESELENVEVYEWWEGKDKLTIKTYEGEVESVTVMCNGINWAHVKSENKELAMYIEVFDRELDDLACTAMKLNQMIELRDYLSEKIEYLNSK